MTKIEKLKVERKLIVRDMQDEVYLAETPYRLKLKAIDAQIKTLSVGSKKSDIAKNVRGFR